MEEEKWVKQRLGRRQEGVVVQLKWGTEAGDGESKQKTKMTFSPRAANHWKFGVLFFITDILLNFCKSCMF